MTKVNSVLVLPLCRDGLGALPLPGVKERVYEAVIEEKTKDYIFLRICKDCCEELGLLPDREIQVSAGCDVGETAVRPRVGRKRKLAAAGFKMTTKREKDSRITN